MEESVNNNPNKMQSLLKNMFNRDFVVSAIIPIIIFSIFDYLKLILTGEILSGLWSISIVLISFIKEKEINAIATMSGIFSAIGLIVTVISKNPVFYLIAPIVQDVLYALLFLGSLFFNKSLIQIIAEQSYMKNISEDFKRQPKYKSAWRILTGAWGALNIFQAILRVILLYSIPMNSYYAISTIYSNISTALLLAFSIGFPKRYWKIVNKS